MSAAFAGVGRASLEDREWFSDERWERDEEEQGEEEVVAAPSSVVGQRRATVEQLAADVLNEDVSDGGLAQFCMFDFDDTLHHTLPSASKQYGRRLTLAQLGQLQQQLGEQGCFFNPEDPLVHGDMLALLLALKQHCRNLLVLSAGSGAQAGSDALGNPIIELTLLTNYAVLFEREFGIPLFDVVGTVPSLLSAPDADCYISPRSLSITNLLHPPASIQNTIDELLELIRSALIAPPSSAPCTTQTQRALLSRAVSFSTEAFESLCTAVSNIAYFSFRGVIPVAGAKRDAMLRYFLNLYLACPEFRARSRVVVYFIDDQPRFLDDVSHYLGSLFLLSILHLHPDFHAFISSSRFVVKTYLMPQYRPTITVPS